jgi:hypothetical protein
MPSQATPEIKKLHLEEVVLFAINHIPQTDPTTLKRFLELVSAGGTFGTISQEQILRKMALVLKYIPSASASSLLVLLDLLEMKPVRPLVLDAPQAGRFGLEAANEQPSFFVEVSTSAGQ